MNLLQFAGHKLISRSIKRAAFTIGSSQSQGGDVGVGLPQSSRFRVHESLVTLDMGCLSTYLETCKMD